MPGTSIPIVRSPSPGISKSGATAVPMMAIGSLGARDRDGTPRSVLDWRRCSNSNGGAVPPVGCSSTVRIGLKLTISMAIAVTHAGQTSTRCMDTATMRRHGSMGTLSRTVCVTSIRTLRSGVLGNGHAPFWNSGRRSDPPLDCNKLSDGTLLCLYRRQGFLHRGNLSLQCGQLFLDTLTHP